MIKYHLSLTRTWINCASNSSAGKMSWVLTTGRYAPAWSCSLGASEATLQITYLVSNQKLTSGTRSDTSSMTCQLLWSLSPQLSKKKSNKASQKISKSAREPCFSSTQDNTSLISHQVTAWPQMETTIFTISNATRAFTSFQLAMEFPRLWEQCAALTTLRKLPRWIQYPSSFWTTCSTSDITAPRTSPSRFLTPYL